MESETHRDYLFYPTIMRIISAVCLGCLLTMGNAERTEPVVMIGPPGLERVVNAMRVIAPELPFPSSTGNCGAGGKLEINGYHITAYRVNHNVTCYGYAIEIPGLGSLTWSGPKSWGCRFVCGILSRRGNR